MKRQCGKTTALLRIADAVISTGTPVLLVTVNHEMKKHIQQRAHQHGHMPKIVTQGEVEHRGNFGFRGYVLADEIYGENLRMVEDKLYPNRLLAAYYTERENG